MKKEIIKSFDSNKADEIFKKYSKPPSWLEFMITKQEWRDLIYQLSEKYPQSLMINYAIQRISESGHLSEIATVSTSAATTFRVFHRVFIGNYFYFYYSYYSRCN